MSTFKPPQYQAAFTLIELIIVVIILGILSAYIFSRGQSSGVYKQDAALAQIIAAGQLAQQLSMNENARNFSLSIQANQIAVQVGGSNFNAGATSYPLVFDSSITLSPTGTIAFDSQGETSATTITINGSTSSVCFETSGYIHKC
jgi:MSHA pilin protein MshC